MLQHSARDPWPLNPYLTVLILFGLVVVQSTIMPFARLGLVAPLLPLLAVVSWVMLSGSLAGAWWAILAGLLLDWFSPSANGLYLIPVLAAAGFVGLLRERLFATTNVLLPAVVTALATVVFILSQRLLLGFGGRAIVWSSAVLIEELVPAVILNLIWLPVVYFPMRALARHAARPRVEWER